MVRKASPTVVAYSYQRFSSPEQAKGDSLRRQDELRDGWLKRNRVQLDTSVTLRDKGVSGFTGKHRENPDRNALAAFLKLVKDGRVPRGSYLIVESLDRLSREHIRPALTLLLNLIDAGIRVVQLLPVEQVFDEGVEPMQLLMAIMELSRGHSESRMKSERVGRAWRVKKRRAAANGEVLTKRVPGWLMVEDDRFVVDEAAAETVRRIYRLATDGHGLGVITKRLNAENVPPIGRGGHWARSYVAKLLGNRAVVGEYQPHAGHAGPDRKPDGPPVPEYFPAILTDQEWYAARAALGQRRNKRGRIGKQVNVFSGLLRDARDGGSLCVVNKGPKAGGRALVSYRAAQGVAGSKYVSFPLDVFTTAVLAQLREIDKREVQDDGPGEGERILHLEGELATVEARLEKLQAALEGGDGEVRAVVAAVRKLEARKDELLADLAEARAAAATPVAAAWDDCHSLVDILAAAPDPNEVRTRLQAVLRRIINGVWCLFLVTGRVRFAAVQVWFAEDRHRDYLIHYVPTHGNAAKKKPAQWSVRSFVGLAKKGDFDLRDPDHAKRLEATLARALGD